MCASSEKSARHRCSPDSCAGPSVARAACRVGLSKGALRQSRKRTRWAPSSEASSPIVALCRESSLPRRFSWTFRSIPSNRVVHKIRPRAASAGGIGASVGGKRTEGSTMIMRGRVGQTWPRTTDQRRRRWGGRRGRGVRRCPRRSRWSADGLSLSPSLSLSSLCPSLSLCLSACPLLSASARARAESPRAGPPRRCLRVSSEERRQSFASWGSKLASVRATVCAHAVSFSALARARTGARKHTRLHIRAQAQARTSSWMSSRASTRAMARIPPHCARGGRESLGG